MPAAHETGGRARTKRAEDLYRLLVESVQDYAIFTLDPTGHITSWNPGAQRIKGYTADEIIGQHFSKFYPEVDIEAGKPARELEIAVADGRVEDEGWRVRKDGTQFWANVIITALHDDAGRLVGFAKVTRDLTERREAEQRAIATARRLAEAEAANRARSEFLAVMSHELRTPLNAIAGYAELLSLGLRGPVTEEQQRDLERIRRSQQHLLAIINDILNYSRLDAGRVTYQSEPVTLLSVIDEIAPLVEPQATGRALNLVRKPCDPNAVARADRSKVEQILLNLLSNAVKFTPSGGGITISCASSDDRVSIVVADTGPGIPEEQRDAIFEPFVQLGRSLTTSHEGTGLGLAISRDLARAMGGDLTVESANGSGAVFRLALPRD
ncbi:MAG: PAS domain-containing sensor histidine kinase [Longimicrobiales bacterium]